MGFGWTDGSQVWQYITLTRKIYLIDCPGVVPASANDSQTSIVLKGVVRVEAIPTPSDHIPVLLTRVKPIYISRTYNLPLPENQDLWTAEDILDKLARQKGRLLKGGEPDLEGVSKILLSDWVRGKIPFFVPPPERPEELNKEEQKKKNKGKQNAAAAEEHAIGVKQHLASIMQKNTFVGDDVRPIEEIVDDESEQEVEDTGDGVEKDGEDPEDATDEEELVWDDVFKPEGAISHPSSKHESSEGEINLGLALVCFLYRIF
jgi:nuclear GTP-binding protein